MMTKTEQTATMPEIRTANARNYWGEKELTNSAVLVVLDGEELREVVAVRWWIARRSDGMSPVHCSVWISGGRESREAAGYGKASGCGYHKESAAFEAALSSAGVKLANNVGGAGECAVYEAMHAIANACGFADCHIRRIV